MADNEREYTRTGGFGNVRGYETRSALDRNVPTIQWTLLHYPSGRRPWVLNAYGETRDITTGDVASRVHLRLPQMRSMRQGQSVVDAILEALKTATT